MIKFTTAASVLTAMALTMPMVCQAQDPVSSLAQVKQLAAAGKTDEAVALCDTILKKFGGNSAVAKQFCYVLPFYAWEKGNIYFNAKDYDKAYDAFKAFADEPRWKDPALLAAAKERLGAKMPDAFAPYLTMAEFQMGNCRYKQGVGTEEKPGDPTKLTDAITHLEAYLDLVKKGKISAQEKKLKLDGQICFLLLQAYILKPEPDFDKAAKYLDMSRNAKSRVPDEMAMSGLNTIVTVAMKDPKNVGWVSKLIESSPSSYKLEPVRAARSAPKFFNYGLKAAKVLEGALQADDMKLASDSLHAANVLFGLVPDTYQVRFDLAAQVKGVGKFKGNVPDKGLGYSFSADKQRKLAEQYKGIADDHVDFEAFALLTGANTSLAMGSPRLAKAGYQILYDRYPNFSNKTKEGVKPMRDTVIFQLSQLCNATGDVENGTKYEKMVEGSSEMGDKAKVLVYNKMTRAVKDKDWDAVIDIAKEVQDAFAGDPSNMYYLSSQFYVVSANYSKKDYAAVVESGNALLKGGNLKAGEGPSTLKPEQANTFECQLYYFVMDSYAKLALQDPAMLDKELALFDEYAAKHESKDLKENPLAPNMYYAAASALLSQANTQADEAAKEKLQEKAIGYFRVITENWKDNTFYPSAELQIASLLINHDAMADKQEAIAALERCADAAMKLDSNGGRKTAANALYCLACYAPDVDRDGEDEAARAARTQGYLDKFWSEVDYEGNPFCLETVSLEISRIADKDSFTKTMDRARTIIAREANYALGQNAGNPDLEKTIYDYVAGYVDGTKKYEEKTLTLDEKSQHFNNFPGISEEDKYTRAIFRMAQIDAMNKEMAAITDNPEAKTALGNDIEKTFRDMTATFKPNDLTNFICVNVGDYLVSYVGRFEDPGTKAAEIDQAVSYYDAVLERNRDMVSEAKLGKANALAFSKDAAKQQAAAALYTEVASSNDPAVYGPALIGLTELHMRSGNAGEAVKTASRFVEDRGLKGDPRRLKVMLMLGEAYNKSGDDKNALLTYMNLYNQNKGNIIVSAPACKSLMEIMWKRNTPASGDRLKGTYKPSDRWTAWNTGQNYISLIEKAKLEGKMRGDERDAYNKVKVDVGTYSKDAAVQKEDKEGKDFQRKLKAGK